MILLKNRDRKPSFKSGKYVEINDAGNYPMELSVDGVCKQETTTGRNLLPNNLTTQTKGGITLTKNDDGSITLNGKSTTGFSFEFAKNIKLKAGTYTNSINQIKNGMYFSYDNLENTMLSNSVGKTRTFTISEEKTYSRAFLWIDANITFRNETFHVQTESGSSVTSYESYTGGQPSPSPEFPQPISTIENSLKITSCNKNLFDMDYVKGSVYGSYTITNNIITFIPSETSVNSRIIILIPKDKFISGQKYTIKANGCNRIAVGYATSVNDTSNYLYFGNKSNVNNISFTYSNVPTDYVCIYLYNTNSTLGTNWTLSEIQLEEGDQPTPYEQHLETQITANLPEGEFIGKINDTYKDTLKVVYKDDGHYHLILNKMIGKVVLDGSESGWENMYLNNQGLGTIKVKLDNLVYKSNNSGICNYYIYKWVYNNPIPCFFVYNENNIGKILFVTQFTTKQDFLTWLSTHNTIVYYALETSYTVDLGIVDTLLSYDEITNIFTDSDLQPVINVKYYKDFKFDKILRSGYNIDEQEYEIAKKQMANGKRKKIVSSYIDCIIKINLGLLDNKTYQEYKEQLEDGEYEYWSYKYNQYKKANFILTKPSITTEYAYDDEIGIDDMKITLEKSSDVS